MHTSTASSTTSRFSIRFATSAWSCVGALPSGLFDELLETLEHYAERCAAQLRAGAEPSVDVAVPIVAGEVVAECTFDDREQSVTVLTLVPCERFAAEAGVASAGAKAS